VALLSVLLVDANRPRPYEADPVAPDSYCITWETDVPSASGPIMVNVTRAWSPLGADRIYALMKDSFFDISPAAFFRVVPNCVLQFGISGTPAENTKWNIAIPDDPVLTSNLATTISFATAGPNTRTTQVFINYVDNAFLDADGFSPFGKVVSGMDVATAVFNPTPGDQGGVDQGMYMTKGDPWIKAQYPSINSITKATMVDGPCQTHRKVKKGGKGEVV